MSKKEVKEKLQDIRKKEKKNDFYKSQSDSIYSTNTIWYLSLLILLLSIIFILLLQHKDKWLIETEKKSNERLFIPLKKYWAFGKNYKESGYLHNVIDTLENFGYENISPDSNDWDLLWAHDYPFRLLSDKLGDLKNYQKINHFPGCGYLTNKVDLATTGLKYIPPAFKLPQDKEKLNKFIVNKPNSTFVEKDNDHRNIFFRNKTEINLLKSNNTFIQEFVANPLLINGHKFDVGIYTIITSIDPLRIYIYNGEALLRFCPTKYYPFDPNDQNKYVIGDDYLPIWKVPSLQFHYNELSFSMKETLNVYLRSKGKNPSKVWDQIEDSIRITILSKEQDILNIVNRYKFKRNFFEMMRFDFLIDEDLNVFLLEANMSPNLSSAHFPPNRLLYQQVLYNVFSLVGIGHFGEINRKKIISDKNIAVFPAECSSILCRENCLSPLCQLCKPCLSHDVKEYLKEAYREHVNKGDCKRIFPPSMILNGDISSEDLENYSPENRLQLKWFQGKCLLDKSWC